MDPSRYNWRLGLLMSLAPPLLWGSLTIVLKSIEGMEAITITWYRFTIAAVFFGILLLQQGTLPTISKIRGPGYKLLIIAILGLTGNFVIFLTGLRQPAMTPEAAQVLIQLGPILTLLGSVFLFRESFRPVQWLGFVIFFAGLILFFHHRIHEIVTQWNGFSLGLVMIIIAAIVWSCYALAQRQLLRMNWSPLQILFLIYLFGTVVLLPFAQPWTIAKLSLTHVCLLLFACFNSITAYALFARAQMYWESSKIAAVLTLTPLITLLISSLIPFVVPEYPHVESVDALSVLGALMVVGGSMRAVLVRKQTIPQPAAEPIPSEKVEPVTSG